MPGRETIVRSVDYVDDGVILSLGFPNITVKMPPTEYRDPDRVMLHINKQYGPRYTLEGAAFWETTRGRCKARWEKLVGDAAVLIGGRNPMEEA